MWVCLSNITLGAKQHNFTFTELIPLLNYFTDSYDLKTMKTFKVHRLLYFTALT